MLLLIRSLGSMGSQEREARVSRRSRRLRIASRVSIALVGAVFLGALLTALLGYHVPTTGVGVVGIALVGLSAYLWRRSDSAFDREG